MINFQPFYLNYKTPLILPRTLSASLSVPISMPSTIQVDPILMGSITITPIVSGTMMRGNRGDIEANIIIPVSMGGTMQLIPPLSVNAALTIPVEMMGEILSPEFFNGDAPYVYFPIFTIEATGILDAFGYAPYVYMPPIEVFGEGHDSCFANSSVVFPRLECDGEGNVSSLGNSSFEIPLITLFAIGQAGIIGAASFPLPRLTIDASTLISSIGNTSITFPLISLSGTALGGIVGTLNKPFPMLKLSAGTFNEILGNGTITLPMFTLETFGLPTTAYLSMVMNLKNRALTLYDNYEFNSLCRFKGKHFGATKTEIYDLDIGTADAGTLIDWNFRIGYLDLEQKNKKKLKQAWLSYKTDGDLILTVIQPNGDEYEYSLQGINETETGLRVKFGKGIKSKYVALDIRNVDGSTITLDTLKLHLDKLDVNR